MTPEHVTKRIVASAIATVLAGGTAFAALSDYVPAVRVPDINCHVGAYRLDGGGIVDVLPLSASADLRWRRPDGTTGVLKEARPGHWRSTLGWTDRPDGNDATFGVCGDPAMSFAGHPATMLKFVEKTTTFTSRGETLYGRMILPEGDAKVPVTVWVHGSEGAAATIFGQRLHMFPALGIGTFVYDKRGTGRSTGTYTQDFDVLADDAAAAVTAARALGGERVGRLGFDGGSQEGWVAPLAATKTKVDFVLVSYGLADSPLAEDRDQAQQDLSDLGYGADVLAKAREITDATGEIMRSHFRNGFPALDAMRAKYSAEPWYAHIKGEYTGELLHTPDFILYAIGPGQEVGTSWDYDPMKTLRALNTPMLWVLAGEDRDAPPDETRARITGLVKDEGRPVVFVEFPDTAHGMIEFEKDKDGKRAGTRQTEGYLRMLADFARDGHLGSGPYGRASITTGSGSPR